MFTDCPYCESQFRIRAAQLGGADGWVKCGNCGETFYALERLYDTPVRELPTLRQTDDEVEPPGLITDPEQAVAQHPRTDLLEPAPTETAEASARVSEEPVESVEQPEQVFTPPQDTAETETGDTGTRRKAIPDLPRIFFDENRKKTGSNSRVIWSSLVVILALVALAQLAWFNRDDLVRRYPALAPWVEQLCGSLRCQSIRARDVSAIELLNKQVSQHPRYRDALLASATMVNNAEFPQRFPDIELLIFATDGQVVSRGRFRPDEYLGPEAKPSSGMPPGVPIHVGLDLTGTVQQGASFRFRFH